MAASAPRATARIRTTRRPDALRPLVHGTRAFWLAVIGIVVVTAGGLVVAHASAWTTGELHVLQWFSDHHVVGLNGLALAIAWIFAPPGAITITAVGTVVVLILTGNVWRGGTFLILVALSWGSSKVIKFIVDRPRPDHSLLAHPLAIEHSASFPSGHVCFAAALAIGIVFTLRDARRRGLLITLCVVGVVLVALSRVYIGVHYPTDVIGAMIYAPAAASGLLWLWLDLALPRIRRTPGAAG